MAADVGDSRGSQNSDIEKSEEVIGEVVKSQDELDGNGNTEENVLDNDREKSKGVSSPQGSHGTFNVFSSVAGDLNIKRKKPFNISRDKHKVVPNGLSPEVLNRPNKRSRVEMEDNFVNFGNLGQPVNEKSLGVSGTDRDAEISSDPKFDLNLNGTPYDDGIVNKGFNG
ncbi:hypothetical protein Hanom_Chr12g01079681 [Helianthus anomalus]